MKNFLRIIIKHFFSFLETIVYRPKIVGIENIPKDKAALICPNHVHALDSPIFKEIKDDNETLNLKEELMFSQKKNFTKVGLSDLLLIYLEYIQ